MNSLQQLHKRTLAIAFLKFMPAVKVNDLPEQCDFFDAPADESTHFRHDLVDCATAFGAARPRYDAKGAMHVAALHDGHECCRRFWREGLIANCRLRSKFLLHIDNGKTRVVHSSIALLLDRFLDVVSDSMKFLRADYQIKMWYFLKQGGAACLRHAAEKTENNVRPLFRYAAEHSHFAERFLIRHIADAAGVQQNYIGI